MPKNAVDPAVVEPSESFLQNLLLGIQPLFPLVRAVPQSKVPVCPKVG